MRQISSVPSNRLPNWPRSTNPFRRIPFDTVSPPTSSKMGTIPSTCGLGRCPHRPGIIRSQRCKDHHDLHPRASARGIGRCLRPRSVAEWSQKPPGQLTHFHFSFFFPLPTFHFPLSSPSRRAKNKDGRSVTASIRPTYQLLISTPQSLISNL